MPHDDARPWYRCWPWLALAAVWLIDFHIDVRQRDAFSWMDPYQYYEHAVARAYGAIGLTDFTLPSVFPLLMQPIMWLSTSIAAALWINAIAAMVLAWSIALLCRRLELRTHPAMVTTVVLATPLLIGLSRELYLEFTLSAVVSLQYALWLREPAKRAGLWFAVLFGFGIAIKTTYPLYFVGPVAAALIVHMRDGAWRSAGVLIAKVVVPTVVVLLLFYALAPHAFGYMATLGNVRLPIMYLIGPPSIESLDSLMFYPTQLGITALLWLTPLLLLPIGLRLRDRTHLILWLWLATPMVLLTLIPVKEPRHIAPCVLPAVLLIIAGLERVKPLAWQRAAIAAVSLAVIGNYLTVTLHLRPTPYFLDRPLGQQAISLKMVGAPLEPIAWHQWKYGHNIAITGFEPNEALALAWHFAPALVYDLDQSAASEPSPTERFVDPLIYTTLNMYNRRCNWDRPYRTIGRQQILDHADFVLVRDKPQAPSSNHQLIGQVGEVRIWRSTRTEITPYRVLWAQAFLEQHDLVLPDELSVIRFEGAMAALGRGDLSADSPILHDPPVKNIYFFDFYLPIFESYGTSMPGRRRE